MKVIQAPQLSACSKGHEAAARRYRTSVFFCMPSIGCKIEHYITGAETRLDEDEEYYFRLIRYICGLTKDWISMREVYNLAFIQDGKDFEFNLDYFTAVFEEMTKLGLLQKSDMVTRGGIMSAYKCKTILIPA